jgi:hypothetical protein
LRVDCEQREIMAPSVFSEVIKDRVIAALLGLCAFSPALPASASSAADPAGWECSSRPAIEIPINAETTPRFDNFIRGLAAERALQRHDVSSLDLFGGFGYRGVTNNFNRYFAGSPGLLLRRSRDSVSGVKRVRGNPGPERNRYNPYHLDIWAGGSQLSWQGIAGAVGRSVAQLSSPYL